MARAVLSGVFVLLVCILTGCYSADSGRSQLMPSRLKTVEIVKAGEADIIEQMSIRRQEYRQYLESLVAYYKKAGDNMKLGWAKDELKRLNALPQYNYIIEASIAGPELKASRSIAEAELMYIGAVHLEKEAKKLIFITDDKLLRESLDEYNQLIQKYPSSDRIDDAAYKAAEIYKHFKDYTIAFLYYQRAYQWDPKTPYPAKYKAAFILDKQLNRRDEALELYRQILRKPGLSKSKKEIIRERVSELTRSDEKEK